MIGAVPVGEYLESLTSGELRERWGSLYEIVVTREAGGIGEILMLDHTERELVKRGFFYDLEYNCWGVA